MTENTPPEVPKKFLKVKINRRQFLLLNICCFVVFGGIFIYLLLYDPTNLGLIIPIIIIWTIVGYVLRILRFNDISVNTQNKLLRSGNMFIASGWLPWIAKSSPDGSLDNIIATSDRQTRLKIITHNFLRYLLLFLAILVVVIVAISLLNQRKAIQTPIVPPAATPSTTDSGVVAKATSSPVIIDQNGGSLIAPQPSIFILSPNGGETWQLGQTQTVRWSSVGITTLTIYIHFSDGGMCREAILPASPGSGSFVLNATCPGLPRQLTPGQYTIGIIDSDLHSNGLTVWSRPFNIVD